MIIVWACSTKFIFFVFIFRFKFDKILIPFKFIKKFEKMVKINKIILNYIMTIVWACWTKFIFFVRIFRFKLDKMLGSFKLIEKFEKIVKINKIICKNKIRKSWNSWHFLNKQMLEYLILTFVSMSVIFCIIFEASVFEAKDKFKYIFGLNFRKLKIK